MKISIIIPTNRSSYSATARVLEVATLDPQKFEVIVRDNSGDARKRKMLDMIDSPALRMNFVGNLGAAENSTEALRLATGDFVLFLADDDWISSRGIEQLHSVAVQNQGDASIACLSGAFLVESSTACGILRYPGIESVDPVQRLSGFLQANAPNVLYYSAVRRPLLLWCYDLLKQLPYSFSFHDQLLTLLYIAIGRVVQIERIVYFYDLGEWETGSGTLVKDRSTYTSAGLPIEVDRLHWLICGLEGALLLRSRVLSSVATFDTGRMVDLWFSTNCMRFRQWGRESGYVDSAVNVATQRVRDKWLVETEANLNELLLDLCDVFEIVDPDGARRYFDYWSTV